jgi:iron complex outermembrane receptor protein
VEGYFRSTAGNYQKADIEAAVTVPLTDSISSRIAFQKNNRGGYADSLNEDGSLREKVGRLDELAARAIFRWQADNTEVTLNLNFSDADNDRSVGKATNTNPDGSNALGWIDSYPNDPRIVAPNYKEIEVAKTKGAFLNVVHDWENVSLTSISAYYHAERFVTLDVDHSPVNLLQLSRFPDSDQFSQEIRLTSRGEHDIDWILGAYYFTEDVTVNNLFTFFDLSVEPFIPQVFSSDTDTLAVFAESIFHLSDRTSITAGARFTHDERDFSLDFGGAPVATGLEDSWDEVSWRGVIDYQFSESAMVYGSISHGFQGGGFNGGAFSEAEVGDGFDPEFLTAYELGVKSHLLGGRLTANAAIFYYDYKDPQVFTIDAGQAQGSTGTGLVQTIVNADSAKIYGAELEMVALIDDSTRMSGSIGLLDTSYGPLDLLGPGGEIISGDGNRLAGAPEYDVTFAFDKRVSLSSGFVMFHVDYNHRSKMYFDITQRELISEPSYGIANARVSYSNNAESIEVALWAKNILDEEVRLWVADVSSSFNITEDIYNLPRTYGIDFIYRF